LNDTVCTVNSEELMGTDADGECADAIAYATFYQDPSPLPFL